MKLLEILPKLQSTYKSIEIKIACGNYQGKWVNLFTKVNFVYEDSVLLNRNISENKKYLKLNLGQKFRICIKYIPVEEFDALSTAVLNGTIEINGILVHYEPIDFQNYDLTFRRQDWVNDKWGEFSEYRSRKHNVPYYTGQSIDFWNGDVIGLGYEDINEAIQLWVDKENKPSNSFDFLVRAPFFCRLEKWNIEENKIKIVAKYHKNLNGLILQYRKYQSQSNIGLYNTESEIGTEAFDQANGMTVPEGDFKIWQIDAEQLDMSQSYKHDAREISLFFQPLGQKISYERKSLTEMVAEKSYLANNPLAKMFAKFCILDKYKEMLLRPTASSKDGFRLRDADNFERAVQWLFSLCGFQTIWLGKDHEVIQDEQGRSSGSADLLCYYSSDKEKTLVLVSCKTSVPDEKQIDMIKNLAKQQSEEMEELGVKVVPMIVSSKSVNATRDKCISNGVSVIDADDIVKIISQIDKQPPNPNLLLNGVSSSFGSIFWANQ